MQAKLIDSYYKVLLRKGNKSMYELYNNYDNSYKNYFNTNENLNIGIYCRLSREDEKEEFNKQSESIENQLKFLKGK